MPLFIKNMMIEIHRDFRLLNFFIFKRPSTKNCKENKHQVDKYQQSRKYGPLKKICYAPYTSIFFARNGKVSPCYASYNNKSDNIQNSNIKDIWFKGSIADIRAEHKNCDLDTTCEFCKTLIIQDSFGSMLTNKYDHYAFSKGKYPRIMEFELSNKCNLSCIMCDSNLSSSIESKDCNSISGNQFYDNNFIKQLDEFIPHLQLAEFTGGDPFMIEEYYNIWDRINEINPKCQILITTNANTMNNRIEKLLQKHKNINFNVSIDSLEEENYANIRRNGNLNIALKNIDKFLEYTKENKTNLNILVCPLTVNRHELHNFIDFANEKDICVYYHTVVKPKNLSLKYLNKQELEKTIRSLEDFSAIQKTKKQKTNFNNFQNLLTLLRNWLNEDNLEVNPKPKMLDESSALEILSLKINNKHELNNKLVGLLNEIRKEEKYIFILNKLIDVDDKVFAEHLEAKDIEEIKQICLDLN